MRDHDAWKLMTPEEDRENRRLGRVPDPPEYSDYLYDKQRDDRLTND